jgi:Zn-dependent protease
MRKIYYSFNEMPFENSYSYENQQTFKFGRKELQHIFISLLVLTVAFAFALAPNPPFAFLSYVVSNIPLAFIAIFTAFFCHEIAHKYMGQKYGYWSEFRMFPMGLVFAAPGAVQIFGRPTKDETGKISVAGPLVNILISSVFLFIWFISSGIVAQVSFFIAYINAFLAMFNLIPFGPLDGWKIFSWKKEIWGLLLIASISTILFLSIA